MLETHSRRLLLDSLQAPDGHYLDFAVGTTYSLDLTALLAAPLAFAFSDWQDRDGRPTLTPLPLLKAVRKYADRICLFCQAGKISVPHVYQPLLASLEDSVIGVNAPHGGSFHPKLWFLRYETDDGSVTYRFLCLSRNMTFDRSWDTMLCLEGPLRDRVYAFAQNHPLGDFVSNLAGLAPHGLSPSWRKRMVRLAYELRRVEFEVPAPFSDCSFWPLGLDEKPTWPFPDRMDRLLVISPFVDDGFLEDLARHEAPMSLVSRPESLAQLRPETIRRLEKVWILDDKAEPESGEVEDTPVGQESSPGGESSEEVLSSSAIPLTGLHAKVYVADIGWSAHVWTGSANATKAGFNRNVEFLVELSGKRKDCGIEATLGSPTHDKAEVKYLADLLQEYDCDSVGRETEEEKGFQRIADQLAKVMAAAAPEAHCAPEPERDAYSIALTPPKEAAIPVPDGCQLRAWPISFAKGTARPVELDRKPWVTFESVSVEGLTAFFAFELLAKDEALRQTFVLNIPLRGAPENRQERLLRLLLNDRDKVLRFLLLLLSESGAEDFVSWFHTPASAEGKKGWNHSLFESTLFESLLRALDRDPEQIDQVAQLVHDLRRTPEGGELLPPGVEAILEPIEQVRRRQR